MTTIERPPVRPVTTPTEDLVTAGLAAWLLVGLFVDGWAHINLSELETFFTPWHALFYSGFTATAVWIAMLVGRRHVAGRTWSESVPEGYRPGVLGLGIFAVGGVGDWIWHTVFGIEESLDALLSPTHLLLFLGMILIVTSPLRAVWARVPGRAIDRAGFRPAMVSTLLLMMVTTFFLLYAWAPTSGLLTIPYSPNGEEVFAVYGVLSYLIGTLVLVAVSLVLLGRWDTPRGTFAFIFGVLGVFMVGLGGFEAPFAFLPPLVAGFALDVVVSRLRPGPHRPRALRVASAVVPLVLVSSDVVLWSVFAGLGWPPELWAGAIVLATLLGVGLSYLTVPYRSGVDQPAA